MASTNHDRTTQPPPDTPESVNRKLEMIPVILDMWKHYIVEDHPGDYNTCDRCPKGA